MEMTLVVRSEDGSALELRSEARVLVRTASESDAMFAHAAGLAAPS